MIRIPQDMLDRVLRWAKKHGFNRSTAIVWMIEHGLDSVGET
jgi:predicted DNA-binding protein